MAVPTSVWQMPPNERPPSEFLETVRSCGGGDRLAALLWQRGWQDRKGIPGFLHPDRYRPASPFAFGEEMQRAVRRLQVARDRGEKVAIWGDFDADGVTATGVLWEGLGQFFPQGVQLDYYIPNRLLESHGLNRAGIERLARSDVRLVITCDTGSTNIAEIELAATSGIDTIVTDHHTLPSQRPPVAAIVNPRCLPADSPLANLSGVAVAYKLVEALYATLPEVPQQPLEDLLDLVAIGLIADLVELTGDCRYLAQRGIEVLQRDYRNPPHQRRRPGIGKLLDFCRGNGDRPTDISFGVGPRINAVSRVFGDASLCVELLTGRDLQRCAQLAETVEIANARRKGLQQEVLRRAKERLQAELDLSTTQFIVLADPQWPGGVLGLVASQIAQEYGRPAALFAVEDGIAKGSARSTDGIDLYRLVAEQQHLLDRFGGHPYAAGMRLPEENLSLLADALNRKMRQQQQSEVAVSPGRGSAPTVRIDLEVTVAELAVKGGQELFRELKWLEPCGMGNPTPQLLVRNCWFDRPWHRNIKDRRGERVRYAKTEFWLCDDTCPQGFPGIWWGHYKDELPTNLRCDAIAQLDYNTYAKRYELRLIDLRLRNDATELPTAPTVKILDWRQQHGTLPPEEKPLFVRERPDRWDVLLEKFDRARTERKSLILAYSTPAPTEPVAVWENLARVARYLAETGKGIARSRLRARLGIGDRVLDIGVRALREIGLHVWTEGETLRSRREPAAGRDGRDRFLEAVAEERFRLRYFQEVPVDTLQSLLASLLR